VDKSWANIVDVLRNGGLLRIDIFQELKNGSRFPRDTVVWPTLKVVLHNFPLLLHATFRKKHFAQNKVVVFALASKLKDVVAVHNTIRCGPVRVALVLLPLHNCGCHHDHTHVVLPNHL
jgi:hypothetical protein